MDTRDAARRWIEAWLRGWPTRDIDTIAAVYADDAPYISHPFRAADTVRTYLEFAFGEEEEYDQAWFGQPVVDGNRAAIEYWAHLKAPTDDLLTIAGTAFLRFDDDGRIVEHRDCWVLTDGALDPPTGWGR